MSDNDLIVWEGYTVNEMIALIAGLEARVALARQAFNVIYNVKQTGDWERGKKLLVELQEQYDGVVPLSDSVISSNRSEEVDLSTCPIKGCSLPAHHDGHCNRDGAMVCATCKRETVNYVYYYTSVNTVVATCRSCLIDDERALRKVATAARRLAGHGVSGPASAFIKDLREALAALDAAREGK